MSSPMAPGGAALLDPATSAFLQRTIDIALGNYVPKNPGLYLRISEDDEETERGVSRQDEDGEKKRCRLGWGPFARTYRENNTSAYKKKRITLPDGTKVWRNVRPKFAQMLKDFENGVIDGILVYDLDRLMRQPRDLEDLIDIVEQHHRPVEAITGQIELRTSNGRLHARFLVSIALKSSEDTSRRVARAAVQDAKDGKLVRGGPRRYGWEKDGMTVIPEEVKVLREIRRRVMSGEGRGTIALDLQARGVCTVTGAGWTSTTINTLMRSPRMAGIRAYTGMFHGEKRPSVNQWWERCVRVDGEYVKGPWKPIMTIPEWLALQHALDSRGATAPTAPAGRATNNGHGRGNPKHLLTGIVVCGVCGGGMVGKVAHGLQSYSCRPKDMGGCNSVSRNLPKLDKYVTELAIRGLKQRKLQARPVEQVDDEAASLDAEIARIEQLQTDSKTEWRAGRYPSKDYFADNAAFNAQLEELREKQARDFRPATQPQRILLSDLASAETPVARKRFILSTVFTEIQVRPSTRGPHFNPADIVPVWSPELAD